MKTLEEQIANRCVHFSGMMNACCAAGIEYAPLKDVSVKPYGYPCFKEHEHLPCGQRRFHTPEEVAAEVAEANESFYRTIKAMRAAKRDAAVYGFGKGKGGNGEVKCPCCEGGILYYRVSGYNGHMHAKCSTDGCASWLE